MPNIAQRRGHQVDRTQQERESTETGSDPASVSSTGQGEDGQGLESGDRDEGDERSRERKERRRRDIHSSKHRATARNQHSTGSTCSRCSSEDRKNGEQRRRRESSTTRSEGDSAPRRPADADSSVEEQPGANLALPRIQGQIRDFTCTKAESTHE